MNYNILLVPRSSHNDDEVKKMKEKLIITKKSVKGEDGYRTFSIRIREELTDRLDELSGRTNRSRNDLINLLLTFALENCEVDERE